ncbi:uncharacterized protein LOC141726476 [Zonotrichia albicollis]|uniref:uncharacterized protein LOC141726476 n=1 Tax=Zonotrichia albicollis TaxID=44394 RepID=UPI003D80CC30
MAARPKPRLRSHVDSALPCSDNVSLWKAMFSVRETLEKVVKELQVQIQDWQDDILTGQQKSCLTFLAMLTYGDVLEKRVRPLYKNMRLVKSPKKEMVPLVLRALETLSESDDMAKKMKSLLPEMLKFLGNWSWDISVMALDTFRNVLGQLKKKEASSMALKAVERLWKLFDAVRLSLTPQRGPGSSTGSRSCFSGAVRIRPV